MPDGYTLTICFLAVFLATFVGILLFFYFRRRRRSRARRVCKESPDQNTTSPNEMPYVGYRATILGISRDKSKQGNQDRGSFHLSNKRSREEKWHNSSSQGPAELPGESTVFSRRLSLNNMNPHLGRHVATNSSHLASKTPEHDEKTSADLNQPSNDAASASNMRIHNWLPEIPQQMLSQSHSMQNRSLPPTPAPSYPHSPVEMEVATSTPTLAEIHDRLTTSDLGMLEPPPTALFNDDSRWSATTHSSNFTAYSARSSGAAFVSALRPPPIPKKPHMETLPESTLTVPGKGDNTSSQDAVTVQVGRSLITGAPKE